MRCRRSVTTAAPIAIVVSWLRIARTLACAAHALTILPSRLAACHYDVGQADSTAWLYNWRFAPRATARSTSTTTTRGSSQDSIDTGLDRATGRIAARSSSMLFAHNPDLQTALVQWDTVEAVLAGAQVQRGLPFVTLRRSRERHHTAPTAGLALLVRRRVRPRVDLGTRALFTQYLYARLTFFKRPRTTTSSTTPSKALSCNNSPPMTDMTSRLTAFITSAVPTTSKEPRPRLVHGRRRGPAVEIDRCCDADGTARCTTYAYPFGARDRTRPTKRDPRSRHASFAAPAAGTRTTWPDQPVPEPRRVRTSRARARAPL